MGGGVVRDFTWREVMDESRRMAAYLKGMGFEPGSRIAILSKNCAYWLMSDFAIWMAGYVSVPLYPTLAAGTIRQILEHSESKLLFVGKLDGWDAMKPGVPEGLPCIGYSLSPPNDYPKWDDIVKATAPLTGEPVRPGDELSTIMYTSGTTGKPKGVMHSFETFAWSIQLRPEAHPAGLERAHAELPAAGPRGRAHAGRARAVRDGHAHLLRRLAGHLHRRHAARATHPVLLGAAAVGEVPPGREREDAAGEARAPAEDPDPARNRAQEDPVRARAWTSASSPRAAPRRCRPTLLRWYADLGLPIIEVYGMTENCGLSHATLPGVQRPGTVGLPYEGVESRIDPASGEIQMKSPGLMLGYYKEPELTREAFTEDGWLHTGDKGQLEPDGYLKITGRVKDLFKTGKGKYVAPAPIEDRLVMHPVVEACVVTGANLGQPLGIVMLTPEAAARAADAAGRAEIETALAAHLQAVNEALDPHEQLDCVVAVTTPWTVDNDIVTPTLKVKRNRIEEVYGPLYERWVTERRTVIWYQG